MIVKDLVLNALDEFQIFMKEYEKKEGITFGEEGYEDFFLKTCCLLKKLSNMEPKETGFVLLGRRCFDDFDEDGELVFCTNAYKKSDLAHFVGYDDVENIEKDKMTTEDKKEFMASHPLPCAYAYDFTPWDEILGMDINEDNLAKFSVGEMLSDILYEMTFYGDEDDMKAESSKIKEMVDEIESMTEEDISDRFVDATHFFDDVLDKYTDREWEEIIEHQKDVYFENWLLHYDSLLSIIKN